jgi:hypothetical protein
LFYFRLHFTKEHKRQIPGKNVIPWKKKTMETNMTQLKINEDKDHFLCNTIMARKREKKQKMGHYCQ